MSFAHRDHVMYVLYHAASGWPKACHTLAHGVPWVYNMGFKIWLKACHILTHGSPWGQISHSHDVDVLVLCHMARHEY